MKIEQNYKFEILNLIERKVRIENSKLKNLKEQIKRGLDDKDYEVNIQNNFVIDIVKTILKETEEKKDEYEESELTKIYDKLIDEKLKSHHRDYSKLEEFQEEIKKSFTLLDEIKWALINIDNWYEKGLNYEEHLKNQAKELAQKIHANPSQLEETLSFLISNDRHIIYFISEEIASLDPTYKKWDLIKKIFIKDKNNRKPEFIIGYLSKYRLKDPDKYNELISEIKDNEGLSSDLFEFAYRKELDEWSIDLIIELYEKKIIDDLDLLKFAHPHRVKSLEKSLYKKLIEFYFKNVKDPLNVVKGSWGDHLVILNEYLNENKDVISEIKDFLLNIIMSFEHFNSEEIIEGDPPLRIPRHITLSRLWRELVFLIIEECPATLKPIRKKILDYLFKLPTIVSQPDVQLLFLKFLEIDKEGTWKDFEEKFINDSDIRQLFQFYFNLDFLIKVPEEWVIVLCKKDPENFPLIVAQMIDENIRNFDTPPGLIVRLIEEFYDNKEFRYDLFYAFDKGVKMYLPGRSAGVSSYYSKKLENWKQKTTSQKMQDWIIEAIDYFSKETKRAQMWDEEITIQPHKEIEDKEFYERESWVNSIKEEYLGKTIAFTNIDGEWKILAHSIDDDELFAQLKEIYDREGMDNKYKVRFRKF